MAAGVDAVQMNVRLGRTLKREGDAALAEAGYTPSQAVRALWEHAVRHRAEPELLRSLLERDWPTRAEAAPQQSRESTATATDPQLLRHLHRLDAVQERISALGVTRDAVWADDDDALLTQALLERYGEERA